MSPRIHCAIYTRKSSEEGLEQSFNSLDAQREAGLAFIQSQRHEGWHAINTHYDDGGFSGGNMDRPALKRLMADIHDGKINTVVVYKVDRLTRSLADFAKIIEQFDAMKVSFVSVTQQFNTTSSLGRLTLNVLLSFAQFEREVTGERIRDKIAASKKKGMWMGGFVPLGYDLRDRKIYVNPKEAETVRTIYSNYLRLGCVMALKDYLDRARIFSKSRTNGNGARTGGTSFSRGALYKILRNRIYAGEIAHKGGVYIGQHDAIINREQWDQVQKLLIRNHQGKRRKARVTKVSLFTGILFDAAANRYTPTHSNKSGRRYRYYTSQAVIRKAAQTEEPARIPAHDLEAAVTERILEFLKSPREVLKALGHQSDRKGKYSELLRQASDKANSWTGVSARLQERFLKAILDRVVIHPDSVEVKMRKEPLIQQLAGKTNPQSNECRECISLFCPFRFANRGKVLRLIVGNDQAPSQINTHTTMDLAVKDGTIRGIEKGTIEVGPAGWNIDEARETPLTTGVLEALHSLASKRAETEFRTDLYGALQLHARHSVATEVAHKLVFVVAAAESFFLRNTTEPIQKNLGERMAFLIGKTIDERRKVIRNVDEFYGLRSRLIHHGRDVQEDQKDVVDEFFFNVWFTFTLLLRSANQWRTRDEMFTALENKKLA